MTTKKRSTAEAFTGGFETEDRVVPDPTLTAGQLNAGDMVYIDQADYYAKPLDTDAHAATFKGVSLDTYPMTVYAGEEESPTIKVKGVGPFNMKTTAGETYYPDNLVYVGADAQTVTLVAGSNPVGSIAHSVDTQAGLLGAAGVYVPVNIRRRIPGDVKL